MGADYRSYAVIGLRIDPSKLTTKKVVKSFQHNYPKDMKFCPQTGKKLWEDEDEEVEGYCEGDDTFFGYDIFYTTDRNEAVISLLGTGGDTYSNGGTDIDGIDIDFEQLAEEKIAFREAMIKANLWEEKEFGLWAVLYCSY